MTRPFGIIESGRSVAELAAEYVVPIAMVAPLVAYATRGERTGDFLRSCLENDFIEAACRADALNAACLQGFAKLIFNELPSRCWGSPARVKDWLAAGEQWRARQEAAL